MKNAILTALVLTAAAAAQQAPKPRQVGPLAIDKLTKAPLRLTKKVYLNAAPAKVFALLERYEDMPKWLPVLADVKCDRTKSGGTNGVGTVRSCSLRNGMSVTESVVGFKKNRLIAYSLSGDNAMGARDHLAVATTEPAGTGTLLTWRQYFNHPKAVAMTGQVDAMMTPGFKNLVATFGGGHVGTEAGLENIVIAQSLKVNAPSDRVWAVLGRDFGGIDKWASLISSAKISTLPGGGTLRSCSTAMGDFKETVIEYDEKAHKLGYRADAGMPPVVKRAINRWTVTPTAGGSVVTMRLTIDMAGGAPTAAAEALKSNFGRVARGLIEELAYYVEKGKPHPRKVAASRR